MRAPEVVTEIDIRKSSVKVEVNGEWFYAKSYGRRGIYFMRRLTCAWLVFTGEYDIFRYEEDRYPKT
jgi:hypothetical protein